MLGQAFMKVSPPRFGEADREFGEARRLRCARPELLVDTIRVKTELQDFVRRLIAGQAIAGNRHADLPVSLRHVREEVRAL